MDTQRYKDATIFWRNSDAFMKQVTEPAKSLKPKDFQTIEDLDPDALPEDSSHRDRLKKTSQYGQLGKDACDKLLATLLTQNIACDHIVIVADINPDVGDMLKSVLGKGCPKTCYYGVCTDENHADWLQTTAIQDTVNLIMQGIVKVPNFSVLALVGHTVFLQNIVQIV